MELTFHQIVALIHPDIHPEITEPSVKMSLCVKYRKEPMVLWNLALKWGLVKGEYNVTAPEAVIPPPIVQRPVNPPPQTPAHNMRSTRMGGIWMRVMTNTHVGWNIKDFPRKWSISWNIK